MKGFTKLSSEDIKTLLTELFFNGLLLEKQGEKRLSTVRR
jgi:hypothetical protein